MLLGAKSSCGARPIEAPSFAARLSSEEYEQYSGVGGVQNCPWLAKCPAGSASADISWGGFMALFLILGLLWLAYVAFSAYIRYGTAPVAAL